MKRGRCDSGAGEVILKNDHQKWTENEVTTFLKRIAILCIYYFDRLRTVYWRITCLSMAPATGRACLVFWEGGRVCSAVFDGLKHLIRISNAVRGLRKRWVAHLWFSGVLVAGLCQIFDMYVYIYIIYIYVCVCACVPNVELDSRAFPSICLNAHMLKWMNAWRYVVCAFIILTGSGPCIDGLRVWSWRRRLGEHWSSSGREDGFAVPYSMD